jgi:hypothetical protein
LKGGFAPMSFHPGTGQARAQPISLSLNVDGRTLAQAVSDLLDRSTTYPTGRPMGAAATLRATTTDGRPKPCRPMC